MLIVNQRHLETVIHEYCLHYNDERPRVDGEVRDDPNSVPGVERDRWVTGAEVGVRPGSCCS